MAILKVQPAMNAGPFFENIQTISTSYTISANSNAVSAGPVTIASGITVTIPSGSRWIIL